MAVTNSTSTKETPEPMNDMAYEVHPSLWNRALLVLTEPLPEIMATLLLAGVLALVLVVGWELGGR